MPVQPTTPRMITTGTMPLPNALPSGPDLNTAASAKISRMYGIEVKTL